MITFITDEGNEVTVPDWVRDIESFRRWTDTDTFPRAANTWWLRGKVWVDMSKEQLFSHLAVKGEIYFVLNGLVRASQSGLLFPDGLLLTNFTADLSGNPDVTYLSNETLESERARLIEGRGKQGGFVEVQGSPDMVLEVVSSGSVQKDTEILREGYWQAGVTEYWLVDARSDPLSFEILRRTGRGFSATRKQGGWVKSAVFGHAFKLTRGQDGRNLPSYRLEVR